MNWIPLALGSSFYNQAAAGMSLTPENRLLLSAIKKIKAGIFIDSCDKTLVVIELSGLLTCMFRNIMSIKEQSAYR